MDHLMGDEPGADERFLPLLIWKNHMRLLLPANPERRRSSERRGHPLGS